MNKRTSEKYEDTSCSEFIKVDDVSTRFFNAMEVGSTGEK